MSTRRRAREIVLQLLYEADVNGARDDVAAKKFIRSRMQGRKGLTEFAHRLLVETMVHREEIDRRLAKLSTHWTLPRMPVTDRNVLRLGAYEILFGGTPGQVAVSEAILLAKRYGDKNSPRFVNGVLDRLYKEKQAEDAVDGKTTPGGKPTPGLSAPTKR
ncbi:MAG: transcription antitermination factor NusB [Planctomycetota bacterium]